MGLEPKLIKYSNSRGGYNRNRGEGGEGCMFFAIAFAVIVSMLKYGCN